jgi:tRNA(Ile2) C34 agmatinyltransferase TiaS
MYRWRRICGQWCIGLAIGSFGGLIIYNFITRPIEVFFPSLAYRIYHLPDIWVFGTMFAGAITYATTTAVAELKRQRKQHWIRTGHCGDCGYDLRSLTVHRCPECGRKFKANTNRNDEQ